MCLSSYMVLYIVNCMCPCAPKHYVESWPSPAHFLFLIITVLDDRVPFLKLCAMFSITVVLAVISPVSVLFFISLADLFVTFCIRAIQCTYDTAVISHLFFTISASITQLLCLLFFLNFILSLLLCPITWVQAPGCKFADDEM